MKTFGSLSYEILDQFCLGIFLLLVYFSFFYFVRQCSQTNEWNMYIIDRFSVDVKNITVAYIPIRDL